MFDKPSSKRKENLEPLVQNQRTLRPPFIFLHLAEYCNQWLRADYGLSESLYWND